MPGVRIVVLTMLPSSWIVIGSSTINSSGRRLTSAPRTDVTSRESLRLRGPTAATVAPHGATIGARRATFQRPRCSDAGMDEPAPLLREADAEFIDIVRLELPKVQRVARLLTGDADAAEELVAEAIARSLPRWRAGAIDDCPAYLRRVVVNLAGHRWRRRALGRRRDHAGDRVDARRHADTEATSAERDRTLRAVMRLPDPTAGRGRAAVLRRPVRGADRRRDGHQRRHRQVAIVARARATSRRPRDSGTGMNEQLESRLRDHLGVVDTMPVDDVDSVMAASHRVGMRMRRRRRAGRLARVRRARVGRCRGGLEQPGRRPSVIATATDGDGADRRRIVDHRADRIELEPVDVGHAVDDARQTGPWADIAADPRGAASIRRSCGPAPRHWSSAGATADGQLGGRRGRVPAVDRHVAEPRRAAGIVRRSARRVDRTGDAGHRRQPGRRRADDLAGVRVRRRRRTPGVRSRA